MGTGLGLAIVKELAAAMGGGVDVNSRPGDGAEFVIRLPVTEPPAAPSPVTPGKSEPDPGYAKTRGG